jgi:hypothetical protein
VQTWDLNTTVDPGCNTDVQAAVIQQSLADTCVNNGGDGWQLSCPPNANATMMQYPGDPKCVGSGTVQMTIPTEQCITHRAAEAWNECQQAGKK